MILIVNIFFSLLSIILILFTPITYSYSFCVLLNVLFIIQNVIYFRFRRNNSLVGFQFFFMIAFYFTNFVYPVFYHINNPDFSSFEIPFNHNIISKATAIAFMAYSFYMLGLSFLERKWSEINNLSIGINFDLISKVIYKLSILSFLMYIIAGGHKALASEYSGGGDLVEKGISSYIYILFVVSTILSTIFIFKIQDQKQKVLYFLSICVYILFFVFLGSRTLPLAMVLILLVSYNNNKRKIPSFIFLILLIIGAVFLTFIMYARSVSVLDSSYVNTAMQKVEFNSFWDIGSDLIINNRNLYTLIDFADTQGHTFGLTMLGGLLSPLPFAQSFICGIFDLPTDFIGSATFNTYLDFGSDSSFGLGTNVVSDVYLAFGLIGVISFFIILGWLVGKAELNINTNIYWKLLYYFLVSNSIYLARSGFFDNLRPIIWALVIVYLYKLSLSIKNKRLDTA